MKRSNYHTHMYLCRHASGTVEEYVEEAIKHNYLEIGISDHGVLPADVLFPRMSLNEFENIYLKEIDDCIKKYGNKISIKKGLEVEYLYGYDDFYKMLLSKLDYLSLALHYFDATDKASKYGSGDVKTKEDLDKYATIVENALDTGLFKFIVHPETFLCGYKKIDEHVINTFERIIKSCLKNNVIIEFNANGYRRKTKLEDSDEYCYPNKSFFELVKKYNVNITIGSDCHQVIQFNDEYVDKAYNECEQLKLKVIYNI